MKKNWFGLLLILFIPVILIVIYTMVMQWADDYASQYFVMTYKFVVLIAGNILIGIAIMLVCMKAFSQKTKHIPFEYTLGILLIPLVILSYYIPVFPSGLLMMVLNYSVPQCFIIGAVYTCLCVYTLRRRGKDLSVKGDNVSNEEQLNTKAAIDL